VKAEDFQLFENNPDLIRRMMFGRFMMRDFQVEANGLHFQVRQFDHSGETILFLHYGNSWFIQPEAACKAVLEFLREGSS